MEQSNQTLEEKPTATGTSMSRRSLLKKAGWAIPVIAVAPLANTASAASAVDCASLQSKLDFHKQNKDKAAYADILSKMQKAGCSR